MIYLNFKSALIVSLTTWRLCRLWDTLCNRSLLLSREPSRVFRSITYPHVSGARPWQWKGWRRKEWRASGHLSGHGGGRRRQEGHRHRVPPALGVRLGPRQDHQRVGRGRGLERKIKVVYVCIELLLGAQQHEVYVMYYQKFYIQFRPIKLCVRPQANIWCQTFTTNH